MRLLIESRAPCDAKNDQGCTPLHLAARGGNVQILVLVLEAGAPLDVRSRAGLTPLDEARAADRGVVVTRLEAEAVARGSRPPGDRSRSPPHERDGGRQLTGRAAALPLGVGAGPFVVPPPPKEHLVRLEELRVLLQKLESSVLQTTAGDTASRRPRGGALTDRGRQSTAGGGWATSRESVKTPPGGKTPPASSQPGATKMSPRSRLAAEADEYKNDATLRADKAKADRAFQRETMKKLLALASKFEETVKAAVAQAKMEGRAEQGRENRQILAERQHVMMAGMRRDVRRSCRVHPAAPRSAASLRSRCPSLPKAHAPPLRHRGARRFWQFPQLATHTLAPSAFGRWRSRAARRSCGSRRS